MTSAHPCRLLFPEQREAEQHSLATQLLEKSGVDYWKRAQELTVEEFGAVARNYHRYLMDGNFDSTNSFSMNHLSSFSTSFSR
jgi:ribosomal protein S13